MPMRGTISHSTARAVTDSICPVSLAARAISMKIFLDTSAFVFYICSMSDATSSPPPTDKPTPSGRLLRLVRKLIDYGKQLGTALTQRTADLASVTRDFGTKDIALILARIRCGLERANLLEARIID